MPARPERPAPSPAVPPLPAEPRGRRRRHQADTVTDFRAGDPRRHGETERPRGAFRLRAGLAAPGRVPLSEAAEVVVADWQRQSHAGTIRPSTADNGERAVRRFAAYAAAGGAADLADVDTRLCQRYVDASNSPSARTDPDKRLRPPAVATRHNRLGNLRRFFLACRALGLTDSDPTVGVVVAKRVVGPKARPLTDAEAKAVRRASRTSAQETRRPAAVALALKGAMTGELPAVRVRDLHLAARKAWVRGGGIRTAARWVDLDDWGVEVLGRRVDALAAKVPADELPDALLVFTGPATSSPVNRQAAASGTLGRVLADAVLADATGVRPLSFSEHAAQQVHRRTGRLEAVPPRSACRAWTWPRPRSDWTGATSGASPARRACPTPTSRLRTPASSGLRPSGTRRDRVRVRERDPRRDGPRPKGPGRPPEDPAAVRGRHHHRHPAAACGRQDPNVYLASAVYPVRPEPSPGRPRHYPHSAYTVFNALISVFGSARQTATVLQDQPTWASFVDGAREHLGPHAVDGVPATGPQRHHWNTRLDTYGQWNAAPLGEKFRELALAQAVQQGLLDPDRTGTRQRPARGATVVGDGKVMNSPTRNRTTVRVDESTGEVKTQRVDSAAGEFSEGGDDDTRVWGAKHVNLSVRDDSYYGRVVLDFEQQAPDGEDEAALAVRMLTRLKQNVGDGMRAVAWDGALSGTHIDPLMRQGLVVVSPVKAKKNPTKVRKGPDRVEKSKPLHPHTDDGAGGPCEHDLWAVGGRVHERLVDDRGQAHLKAPAVAARPPRQRNPLVPLGRHRLRHQRPATRGHRPAPHHQGGPRRRAQPPEVLRQLPPDGEDYDHVYGYRPDAESLNCQAEQRFYFHRLPAYGAGRQAVILIGFALAENAVSRYHHQRRQADARPAA